MKLTDREWGSFNLMGDGGLLTIESTKSGIDKNKLTHENDAFVPYITRTDLENGISLFVSKNQDPKYKLNEGNTITLGLDTQTVFYQPCSFFTGQNIQVMDSDKLNKHSALFLIRSIKIQMRKFNWGGNGATLGRLAKTKIMLPITPTLTPDWEFMEAYIREREEEKIKQYKAYAESVLAGLEYKEVERLGEKEWEDFKIEDIFKVIKIAKSNDLSKLQDGEIPFIGRSDQNNGFQRMVESPSIVYGNCLSVGMVGTFKAYYQDVPFTCSQNMMILRCEHLDKCAYIFLSNILNNSVLKKFSYGKSIKISTFGKEKIMLPVTPDKLPDWEYMEQYTTNKIINNMNNYIKGAV